MNAPGMCKMMTLLAGIGLMLQVAQAEAMSPKLIAEVRAQGETALASIRAEQLADLRQRSVEQLTMMDPAPAGEPFSVVANEVRLQGRLALWSIQEQMLAEMRTGADLKRLVLEQTRSMPMAATGAGERKKDPRGNAEALFKTTRFQLPDLLPPVLR